MISGHSSKGNKRTRGNLNFGDGFYFTPDRSMAENYTSTGRVVDAFLKLENPYTFYGTRFYNGDLTQMALQFGQEVTIENVTQVLQQMGYDGIVARNYDGNTNPVNQYVVFDSNKIKSADPVTYDNDGNVIPISERFDQTKDDIRYSVEENLSDEEWEQRYRLSLPSLDESGNNSVDKTAGDVENGSTDNLTRGEQYDNGRVREGAAKAAGHTEFIGRADSEYAGQTQKNKEWGNQTTTVQKLVRRQIKRHINESPNASEVFELLCFYVNRTDETITPYTYNKAISILSEKVFDDAISLHPVMFENKWSILGGSISSLRKAVLDSAGINMNTADTDRDTGLDRYSAEEYDNPLLALTGERKTAQKNTAQDGGERYSAEEKLSSEEWEQQYQISLPKIKENNTYLNAANMTLQEEESGRSFAEFVEQVNKMIDKSRRSKRKYRIGTVSNNHADLINRIMQKINPGFSANGYELWIDGTGAAHIEDRHGKNGKQDKSMASDTAKMLIPWAAQNATEGDFIFNADGSVRKSDRFFNQDQSKAPEIRLEKEVDEDTVYVSECVPDSANKRIWITSAYIKKGSKGQMLNIEETSSPQLTSETPFDGNATNNSVTDYESSVKEKFSIEDEDDNPLLALKGETQTVDYEALESQYTAENRNSRAEWFTEKLGEEGYQRYREYAAKRDELKKQQSRETQAQKSREKKARIDAKMQENVRKNTEREEKKKQGSCHGVPLLR